MNSGRLNLCPKTRELTAKLPKYTYSRGNGNGRKGCNGRNGDVKGDDDDSGGGGCDADADGGCRGRGGRSGGSIGYRDAGDRLYSEWEATRRRNARRQEVKEEAERRGGAGTGTGAVTAGRGVPSEGAWSCPKCGAENRRELPQLLL